MNHTRANRYDQSRLLDPRCLIIAGLLSLTLAVPVQSQVAAPGDVYYDIHLDQTWKYGPFVSDVAVWANTDAVGTAPFLVAAHDTTLTYGLVGASVTATATGGAFRAELAGDQDVAARTGIFSDVVNRMVVDVYVKGPSGTPYRLVTSSVGSAYASRLGGLPGSLAPLNGQSYASFGDSVAYMDVTGVDTAAVYVPETFAGHTTTAITVGTDTYSLARSLVFSTSDRATQAVCIIGCMTEAANFSVHSAGQVAMDVYLCTDTVGGGGLPCADVPSPVQAPALPVTIVANPNPFNPRTEVSFTGLAGQTTVVEVFDVRGRLVRRLYDGPARGIEQRVTWDAEGEASGVYLVRAYSGGEEARQKLLLLR